VAVTLQYVHFTLSTGQGECKKRKIFVHNTKYGPEEVTCSTAIETYTPPPYCNKKWVCVLLWFGPSQTQSKSECTYDQNTLRIYKATEMENIRDKWTTNVP